MAFFTHPPHASSSCILLYVSALQSPALCQSRTQRRGSLVCRDSLVCRAWSAVTHIRLTHTAPRRQKSHRSARRRWLSRPLSPPLLQPLPPSAPCPHGGRRRCTRCTAARRARRRRGSSTGRRLQIRGRRLRRYVKALASCMWRVARGPRDHGGRGAVTWVGDSAGGRRGGARAERPGCRRTPSAGPTCAAPCVQIAGKWRGVEGGGGGGGPGGGL